MGGQAKHKISLFPISVWAMREFFSEWGGMYYACQLTIWNILPNPGSVYPNAPNEVGITPIFYAAMFGHTEILKILDSFTIYIYLQWWKLIPLEMEINYQIIELAELLVSYVLRIDDKELSYFWKKKTIKYFLRYYVFLFSF